MKEKASTDPISHRRFLAASSAAVAGGMATHGFAADRATAGRPQGLSSNGEWARRSRPMMRMAEIFSPTQDRLWKLVKQCGADDVVGTFSRRGREEQATGEKPWSIGPMTRLKKAYEERGFNLAVIESRPPTNNIKLGIQGRDEEIENVIELIKNMGDLGIPVWCYEWMPGRNWSRTDKAIPSRGGALVTGFDAREVDTDLIGQYGNVTEERLWDNLKYFLERVVPVAEKAGVKLAMHPDDPPLSPLFGLPRIMRSIENYQRLVDLVPSSVNGITLCQGNFTLMTDDLPGAIRHFGKQNTIHFVHFRDVRGTPERFEETFHDNGMTDMVACMEAYRDIGFTGVCRPDHVPTMEGDSNDRPGYSTIGRLFALGYIRGLVQSVYG